MSFWWETFYLSPKFSIYKKEILACDILVPDILSMTKIFKIRQNLRNVPRTLYLTNSTCVIFMQDILSLSIILNKNFDARHFVCHQNFQNFQDSAKLQKHFKDLLLNKNNKCHNRARHFISIHNSQ